MKTMVLGEALIDELGDERLVGGSPLNVAVGLGRLGVPVTFASHFGTDELGDLVARHLRSAGVVLAPGSQTARRTTVARATVGPDGSAQYRFDLHWRPSRFDASGFALIHVGSLGAYIPAGMAALDSSLRSRSKGTIVSFDPNIRPGILDSHEGAVARTEALVRESHIVKMSEEDAAWLHPHASVEAVLHELIASGAQLAVVTRGGRGYTAADARGPWESASVEPAAVTDTIGAGDSFMSGLLFGVLGGGFIADVRRGRARREQWESALRTAQATARITVGRKGADPPTLRELRGSSPAGRR